MWQALKNKILSIKEAAGVEIVILPDNQFAISLIVLTTKKGVVTKTLEHYHLTTLEQLVEKVKINTPLAIIINGKGVLQKKVDGIQKNQKDLDFSTLLPSFNPTDFFIALTSCEGFTNISLARKDTIEAILEKLKNLGFNVLSITIGFKSIVPLLPLLQGGKNIGIETNTSTLVLNNNKIVESTFSVSKDITPVEFNIGNQYIKSNGLIAYGAALNLMINAFDKSEDISFGIVKKDKENYANFLFFKAACIGLLAFLFTTLLINFIVYNHYFSKNNYLKSIHQSSSEQIDKIKTLENNVRIKENFIQNSGWQKPSKLSFYADRIGAAVPDEVLLTSLNINPQSSSQFYENGSFSFKKDTILVTGNCENPLHLNYFVDKIKNIEAIKQVVIKNYSNKKEAEGGIFSLELITK